MKTGNVTGDIYDRSIHKKLNMMGNERRNGAGGENCAVFARTGRNGKEMSGGFLVAAQAQSVYTGEDCGKYAVYAAANQAAAAQASAAAVNASTATGRSGSGADVSALAGGLEGILLTVALPVEAKEQALRHIVEDAAAAALCLGATVADVKASVTPAVNLPVVTATAIGAADADPAGQNERPAAGAQIVMTKWAGLEGSVMLATRQADRLAERYPSYLIEDAKNFDSYLSIASEAAVAGKSGVSALCSVSEGGVFRALWTLAQRAGVGLEIDIKKIPIRQETVEICNYLNINPYELMGNGSLLCMTEHGERLVADLQKAGIAAAVIGMVTDNNDRVIVNGGERRFLEPAKEDEIYQI